MNDVFFIYWNEKTLKYKINNGNAKISINNPTRITFEESLHFCFKNYYKNFKDENVKEKLIEFFKDFEMCDEFQLLHLNTFDKNFVKFREKFDTCTKKELSSFSIVGKRNDIFDKWNCNSVAIFFNIEFKDNQNNHSKDWIKFRLVRIEFLDLCYIEKNLNNVKFEFKELDSVNLFENKYTTEVLSEIKKSVDVFDESSSDKLKIKEWKSLIEEISWKNKENDNNIEVIPIIDYIYDEIHNVINNVLVSSKFDLHNSEKDKFILVDPKDEDNKFNIKFSNIKKCDEKNWIKRNYIEKLENKINDENKKKDNNNNEIKAIKKWIEEKESVIVEYKKNRDKLYKELEEHKKDFKSINEKLKECKKNIENHERELKVLKKEDNIQSNSASFYKEIENYRKKSYFFDEKIKNIERKIDSIDQDIEKNKENCLSYKNKYGALNKDINNIKRNIEKLNEKLKYFNHLDDYISNKKIYELTIKFLKKEELISRIDIIAPSFFSSMDNFSNDLWKISSDDIGLIRKFQRYNHSMRNIKEGIYKNPYIIKSIITPSKINNYKDVPLEIINKYQLNDNQLKSVKGSISTNDNFYLQGPPGTGKTQTICAITECIINENKNVLMTSSTHEAINNYFDRLDEFTKDNPNIILLKQDSLNKDRNKTNDYDFNKMFYKFFEKTLNYVENIDNSTKFDFYKNKFNDIYKEIDNPNITCYTDFHIELIYNDFKKNSINKNQKKFLNSFWVWMEKTSYENDISLVKNNINDFKFYLSWFIREINKEISILKYKKKQIFDELELIIEKISEYCNIWDFNSIKELYEFINAPKPDNFNSFKSHFKNYFKDNINEDNENSFLFKELNSKFIEYVFQKNSYINVIGMTTTSRTDISFDNWSKDLFFGYPIDVVIIDEISKSSTPEILSRIILAKKSICCGDYKQLPPTSDLNDTDIKKYFSNLSEEDIKEKNKEIELLYKESFFNHQVQKTKSLLNNNMAYQFLNIQHRFNKDIMDVVNYFYDNEEKLEMPINSNRKLDNIKFTFFDNSNSEYMNNYYYEDVVLIDTTRLYTSFINEYCQNNCSEKTLKQISSLKYSFDQNEELINKKLTIKKATGRFNEQNAFLIIKSIIKFVDDNKNIVDDIASKIGVICLTSNQKHIIISLMKEMISDEQIRKKIKIDTIDNFQGREKDFVFVDFVRSKYNFDELKNINNKNIRNLSFISSNERINVAISRAKSKLYLFGSFSYYIEDESKDSKEIKDISRYFVEKISTKIGK